MVDTSSVETMKSGTDVWNVSDAFVKMKLFKPMWDCDRYEMVALYGSENYDEVLPPEIVVQRRIDALYRLKDTLKLLFSNAKFIIRKGDKVSFVNMRNHLYVIEGVLDGVASIEENQVTKQKQIMINEKHFRKCLTALQKLKEDIHTPLNNCGVIFRQTDDMDIGELMQDIIEGG